VQGGGYAPESAVSWLAFDAAEAEQFRTMLEAFDDPGTLDPVGVGSVRDAVAGTYRCCR
jgi:hypothetical protein